jgi:hypothetical protein
MASSLSTALPVATDDNKLDQAFPVEPGENCIVCSSPEDWAQRAAWDIREHDRYHWLEARHGAKPEEFWPKEFIAHRGRPFCEAVLKYIIMLNHEEVGGHAVMFIDQMLMHWPHYFPYSMKYRCNVDELFELDQIEHYGRLFLEKVVEWCKLFYQKDQAYWDYILDNPPMDQQYDTFVEAVKANHRPQKLKTMNIVPPQRPDQWPADYFAEARGKTSVPRSQLDKEKENNRQLSGSGSGGAHKEQNVGTQPRDTEIGKQTNTTSGAEPASSNANSRSAPKKGNNKQTHTGTTAGGCDGGDGYGYDSDQDKKPDLQVSKSPASLKDKKSVASESVKAPQSFLHRRVKSEPDSPGRNITLIIRTNVAYVRHLWMGSHKLSKALWLYSKSIGRLLEPSQICNDCFTFATNMTIKIISLTQFLVKKSTPARLSLADWMTSPGTERRAVSTESQSQLITTAVASSRPDELPAHGSGGAQKVGRYQYQPGTLPPVFAHPYDPQAVTINNAAYLYHEDQSFGRAYPPRPDHSTTYRLARNVYQTDPHSGDTVVPSVPSQANQFMSRSPYNRQVAPLATPRAHPTGRRDDHIQQQAFNTSVMGSHMSQVGEPGQLMLSPTQLAVVAAPFGSVPVSIMAPYVQRAQGGQWPHAPPPPFQVGQAPLYPGMPLMPRQFIPQAPRQAFQPNQHYAVPAGAHSNTEQRTNLIHLHSSPPLPHMGRRGARRTFVRSDPVHINQRPFESPLTRYGGPHSSQTIGHPSDVPTDLMGATSTNADLHWRVSNTGHSQPHVSTSDEAVPLRSYYNGIADPATLTEREQCTNSFIGPDAEDVVTLWFGDIQPNTSADQLKSFIEKKMPVAHIKDPITYDSKQNFGRGWTFVRFMSNSDTRIALEYFQGLSFNGGQLKVQVPERRTREGLERRSFSRYRQPQSFGFTTGFAGHRPSFSGGSTPSRLPDQNPAISLRTSRGCSM